MPKFLSEEWVTQARAIQEEFKGQTAAPPAEAKINLTITEVPDEVQDGPIHANIDTTEGAAELDLGHHETSDAQITLEYETAKAFLVEGNPQVVMQAVMSGKVRIAGDMTKVLALQGGVPGEAEQEVARRLRDITD